MEKTSLVGLKSDIINSNLLAHRKVSALVWEPGSTGFLLFFVLSPSSHRKELENPFLPNRIHFCSPTYPVAVPGAVRVAKHQDLGKPLRVTLL